MRTSKSAVFLFELMIIILVFTLAAAVCTQIFARAYTMSEESRELTMASMRAQTEAELWKAGLSEPGTILYDKDWAEAGGEADARYLVKIDEYDEYGRVTGGDLMEAEVTVYRIGNGGNEGFYSLHVCKFRPWSLE